jgi:hypothetical protein
MFIKIIRSTALHKNKRKGGLTDDKVQSSLWGGSSTASEQVLDSGTSLDAHRGAVLPPGDRAPLGIYKSLIENVVEDVFEIEEVRRVADIEKLCGNLLVGAGRLMVGDPEFVTLGLGTVGGTVLVDLRAERYGGHVCVER